MKQEKKKNTDIEKIYAKKIIFLSYEFHFSYGLSIITFLFNFSCHIRQNSSNQYSKLNAYNH